MCGLRTSAPCPAPRDATRVGDGTLAMLPVLHPFPFIPGACCRRQDALPTAHACHPVAGVRAPVRIHGRATPLPLPGCKRPCVHQPCTTGTSYGQLARLRISVLVDSTLSCRVHIATCSAEAPQTKPGQPPG